MPTTTGAPKQTVHTGEEEEMIKQAMEMSMQIEQMKKRELEEEEEMIKRAMEMSEREEAERQDKIKRSQEDEIVKLRNEAEAQRLKLHQ